MERRAEGCVWAQLMPVPLANAALRQANVERPQMSKTSSTQPTPYSSLHTACGQSFLGRQPQGTWPSDEPALAGLWEPWGPG